MLGLLIAIIVVIWVARFVLKKYPAQPILFTAGIGMMFVFVAIYKYTKNPEHFCVPDFSMRVYFSLLP